VAVSEAYKCHDNGMKCGALRTCKFSSAVLMSTMALLLAR
jgi:hypothetical protein